MLKQIVLESCLALGVVRPIVTRCYDIQICTSGQKVHGEGDRISNHIQETGRVTLTLRSQHNLQIIIVECPTFLHHHRLHQCFTGFDQEIEIKTISEKDGYIVLNKGDYEFSEGSVWLYEGLDMNYWIADFHDNSWLVLDTVRVPVPDRLLFLDEIDPSSGETLLQPAVHSGKEFLEMLEAEKKEGPGFEANNVSVVFDGDGDLALIRRYYVPWQ